jgi:CDP-glycerol glycerophosphotransferase
MSILTISECKEHGYREAFFTFVGIGDNLLLLLAARKQYELTRKKILIGTNIPSLVSNIDYCDAIIGLTADTAEVLNNEFNKYDITLNAVIYEWDNKHIYASFCELLGVSGEIIIDPQLDLPISIKKYGEYFGENQIAVISETMVPYKKWGYEKTQSVVNALKNKYNFVQIGSPTDYPLHNILDKRDTLYDSIAILSHSKLFLGSIGALSHFARAVNCRSVIPYSRGEPFYMASYPCNYNLFSYDSCSTCYSLNTNMHFSNCDHNFCCIRDISIDTVISAIETAMNTPQNFPLESDIVTLQARDPQGIELLRKFNRNVVTRRHNNPTKKAMIKLLRDRVKNNFE